MIREEAIKVLQSTYDDFCQYDNPDDYYAKVLEARNMAIQALQTEPCEDAISRQAVIDIIVREEFKGDAIDEIEKLPSVQPTVCIAKISFDDQQMKEMIDKAISDLDFSDLISRQAAIRWVKTECNPYGKPTLDFESGKKVIEHLRQMPSAHPEIIRCKDCDEWHKGKNRDGSDVYSDEGYCSVHRIITGENYYCGDAERR